MSDQPTLEEFAQALEELPPEYKAQLSQLAGFDQDPASETIDSVAVKMELIKFVTELQKHNQACDWETNKIKPKKISIDNIIVESQKLYDFLTE